MLNFQSHAYNLKILFTEITDQEFKALPELLQSRVLGHNKINSELTKKWSSSPSSLGKDFIHYHHWALGIIKFNRALRPNNIKKREFLLKSALGEYNYVLRHTSPQNQFRYLFHLRRGEIYYIQGKYSAAGDELQNSLNYKNDYKQTYVVLSKVYEALGMKKQAKEALRRADELKLQ